MVTDISVCELEPVLKRRESSPSPSSLVSPHRDQRKPTNSTVTADVKVKSDECDRRQRVAENQHLVVGGGGGLSDQKTTHSSACSPKQAHSELNALVNLIRKKQQAVAFTLPDLTDDNDGFKLRA